MSDRHVADFRQKLYPIFSRRATQVCILSAALEKIARGAANPQTVAFAALEQANPFGWNERRCKVPPPGWWCSREHGHEGPCAARPTDEPCDMGPLCIGCTPRDADGGCPGRGNAGVIVPALARHCGNCADGVPGGPDNCGACGREQQYSHWKPRFQKTSCSQCGGEFGPGNEGFSHCEDHGGKP